MHRLRAEVGIEPAGAVGLGAELSRGRRLERGGIARVRRERTGEHPARAYVTAPGGHVARAGVVHAIAEEMVLHIEADIVPAHAAVERERRDGRPAERDERADRGDNLVLVQEQRVRERARMSTRCTPVPSHVVRPFEVDTGCDERRARDVRAPTEHRERAGSIEARARNPSPDRGVRADIRRGGPGRRGREGVVDEAPLHIRDG